MKSDRTAVVTGGANGIGAGIVRRFKAEGYDVAIVDAAEANLERFTVAPGEGTVSAYVCDVTDAPAVAQICDEILARHGPVSILVNNAGGSGSKRVVRLEDHSDEIWAKVGDLNLTSIIRFGRALVPGMRAQRFGRIINISSSTRHGMKVMAPTINSHLGYVTFKAAMEALTRQLAHDLGPDQITVNTVAPGITFADPEARIGAIMKAQGPDFVKALVASIPLGRVGTAEDIAAVVNFLASEEAGYVSGQTFDVSGGSL